MISTPSIAIIIANAVNSPNIEGTTKPIYDNYRALPPKYFNPNVFKNMFHKEREYKIIQNASMVEEGRKLLWLTREYSNACYFISNPITSYADHTNS